MTTRQQHQIDTALAGLDNMLAVQSRRERFFFLETLQEHAPFDVEVRDDRVPLLFHICQTSTPTIGLHRQTYRAQWVLLASSVTSTPHKAVLIDRGWQGQGAMLEAQFNAMLRCGVLASVTADRLAA